MISASESTKILYESIGKERIMRLSQTYSPSTAEFKPMFQKTIKHEFVADPIMSNKFKFIPTKI